MTAETDRPETAPEPAEEEASVSSTPEQAAREDDQQWVDPFIEMALEAKEKPKVISPAYDRVMSYSALQDLFDDEQLAHEITSAESERLKNKSGFKP